jgi:5-methylphenazine-1-carboxylate 1-monooxygenase
MKVLVVGAGIGGLSAALSLNAAGIEVDVFEQAHELEELGVGMNLLPHATKELDALGLLPALDRAGVRTRELIYANRFGQFVWRESRGTEAGHEVPQFSIHRGKLHGVLVHAVLERLGAERIHLGVRFIDYRRRGNSIAARFTRREDGGLIEASGDVLVGCDGIHSAVRSMLYPGEGPPVWSGSMLWRGAVDWPAFEDGSTMLIAGDNEAKVVVYPIHADPRTPRVRLTNWAVMARVGHSGDPPPRREDWSRPGNLEDALRFVRDRFRLDAVDPVALIRATGRFYEYPNCDRDPLPRWSFDRVTLLGDAAHPMYPVGSNGASQAILDAASLARQLSRSTSVNEALARYDAERRPATSAIVLSNRTGGPERVIDMVQARAPNGFDDIETVAPLAERAAIVRGYATLAGFALRQAIADETSPSTA